MTTSSPGDPASFIASSFNCFLRSVVFLFCFCPAAMSSEPAEDLLLTIEEGDELLLGEEGEVHMDDV